MEATKTTVLLALGLVAAAFAAPAQAETTPLKFDDHLQAALEASPGAVTVIVSTVGPAAPAADAARALGAQVVWEYTLIDAFAGTVPRDALDELAARPNVARIHLDRPVAPVMDVSHRAIEADKAWAAGYKGAGVTVAVIDTGIDMLHPFFSGAVVSCVSTIGGLVTSECTDTDGHGTHVAGTVASRDTTYPGVAPEANLAVVRVLHALGTGTSADIIAGMEWVANNQNTVNPPIQVATMSIGYANPGCGDDSDPMAKAANSLVDSGIPFTVAAGNSGHKSCTIDGASAASKVVTIAAIDDKGTVTQDDDEIAGFSSGGGDKLKKPDVSFPGVDITSAYIGGGALIATLDGTSMATPHAAGTAALLLQANPGLTPQQVKDAITGNAVKNAHTGSSWNSVYGHGLGNACTTLGLTTCASGGGGGGGVVYACDDGVDNDGDGKVDLDDPGCESSTDDDETDPAPIALSANGYKVKGVQHVDLTWSGATSTNVDVLRDGAVLVTTANDGAYTDNVGQKGGGSYAYQVCEAGTTTCSDVVTVTF